MVSPCGSNTSLWSARLGDAKRRCPAQRRLPRRLARPGNASTQSLGHGKNADTLSHMRAKQGPKSDELNLELYLTGDAVLAEIFCHDPNWSHRILDQIE
jgi:hypothetical protein